MIVLNNIVQKSWIVIILSFRAFVNCIFYINAATFANDGIVSKLEQVWNEKYANHKTCNKSKGFQLKRLWSVTMHVWVIGYNYITIGSLCS